MSSQPAPAPTSAASQTGHAAPTVLQDGDALLLVDVQRDFLPGGALAVPQGNAILPLLARAVAAFEARGLPIFATRDWHPTDHCSFRERGGPWPAHCIAGTPGAAFALVLPPTAVVVSKATRAQREAYSGFGGTQLTRRARARGVERFIVGGLATDYCVLHTVCDALARGFAVLLALDAVRAVNAAPGDGARAIARMQHLGARPVYLAQILDLAP